jgi:hypothetical protein
MRAGRRASSEKLFCSKPVDGGWHRRRCLLVTESKSGASVRPARPFARVQGPIDTPARPVVHIQ